MYPAIVLMPLAGAFIAGFFGRILGDRASGILTSLLVLASAVLSWYAFYQVGIQGEDARITLMPWIGVGDLQTSWALRIDTLTAVMLVVVNTVSALVHFYSIGYMHDDDRQPLPLQSPLDGEGGRGLSTPAFAFRPHFVAFVSGRSLR